MEKYKIIETIGDGTYGTVYKCINTADNEYVAIKKMKKKYPKWDECISLKEVKALVGLKHPNIVTLNELILEKEELNMIFEFIGVNLYEWANQIKDISENKIRNIIFQVLQGLAYMHRQNFFHRDMKPENILISDEIVKIADFGLAKEIRSRPPFTDYVATRWYRSPEVILKSKSYNSPIDVFALGAIMAELYNSKPLFPGKNEFDQMTRICEVLGTPSQNDWSEGYQLAKAINYKFPSCKGYKLRNAIPRANDNAISLLEAMLNFNPIKRPSPIQCLQHPFFQCYDILTLFGLKIGPEVSSFSVHANSNPNNPQGKNKPNATWSIGICSSPFGAEKVIPSDNSSSQNTTSTNTILKNKKANNSAYEVPNPGGNNSYISNVYTLMNMNKTNIGQIYGYKDGPDQKDKLASSLSSQGRDSVTNKTHSVKFEDFLNSKN